MYMAESHARKLAITSIQLPSFGMYLLTFDEFHWAAASDGCEFTIVLIAKSFYLPFNIADCQPC